MDDRLAVADAIDPDEGVLESPEDAGPQVCLSEEIERLLSYFPPPSRWTAKIPAAIEPCAIALVFSVYGDPAFGPASPLRLQVLMLGIVMSGQWELPISSIL